MSTTIPKALYNELFAKYDEEKQNNEKLALELEKTKAELKAMRRLQWEVTPRIFIDDVEAIYDTEFRHQTRNTTYPNFPSDPKAQPRKMEMVIRSSCKLAKNY